MVLAMMTVAIVTIAIVVAVVITFLRVRFSIFTRFSNDNSRLFLWLVVLCQRDHTTQAAQVHRVHCG
jgi:hypothetical protein